MNLTYKATKLIVVDLLANDLLIDEKLLDASRRMDAFEGYESGQAGRILEVSEALADKLRLSQKQREILGHAALIHDIGELAMDREYIRENRGLRSQERLDLERHPVIGEQEAARLGLPKGAQLVVRWHHEWWNGSGYPDRLSGEQIPLAARILRLADSWCAMTARRPWRAAIDHDDAKRYLIEWAAIEFDPAVVLAFLDIPAGTEPARGHAQENTTAAERHLAC